MPRYSITKSQLNDLKKSYDFYCKDKKITLKDLQKILHDFDINFTKQEL